MSRHRFEAYLDKVFDFAQLVGALPEGRHCPRHPWQRVFDAVFLGVTMQVPSLLQIEAECRSGALAKRIGPISDDTIVHLGRRFLDLLVGDALYLQAPFAKEVEHLGLAWAFTLKENQPELLREAQRWTTGPPPVVEPDSKQELRCWHVPQIDWPVADRLVRVVKTTRIDHKRQVAVTQEDHHLKKTKAHVAIETTNFYATNFELGAIPPTFIHQLGRSRWRIDTEVFQTITSDCHLKHPAVHQSTALVVLTMIRLLAYVLSSLFYHRQVRSHARGPGIGFHEFAKQLAYGFVALAANTS